MNNNKKSRDCSTISDGKKKKKGMGLRRHCFRKRLVGEEPNAFFFFYLTVVDS